MNITIAGEPTWSIKLPMVIRDNFPNAMVNRFKKAKAKKISRGAVLKAVDGIEIPKLSRCLVSAHFIYRVNRKRDSDGCCAALKATIDQLVDCGLLEDDNTSFLNWLPSILEVDKSQNESVTLNFYQVQEDIKITIG